MLQLAAQLSGKVKLAAAIHAAMRLIKPIGLDGTAPTAIGGFKYRGIAELLSGAHDPLVEAGLLVIPTMVREPYSTGKLTRVEIDYVLVSVDGAETATIRMWGDAQSGPLAVGGAMSYAYKALMFQLLCVPTDGARDTEQDVERPEPVRRQQQRPAQGQRGGQQRRQTPAAAPERTSVPAPAEMGLRLPANVPEWKALAKDHNVEPADVFEAIDPPLTKWTDILSKLDDSQRADLYERITLAARLASDHYQDDDEPEGDDHEPMDGDEDYDGPDGAPFDEPIGDDHFAKTDQSD